MIKRTRLLKTCGRCDDGKYTTIAGDTLASIDTDMAAICKCGAVYQYIEGDDDSIHIQVTRGDNVAIVHIETIKAGL